MRFACSNSYLRLLEFYEFTVSLRVVSAGFFFSFLSSSTALKCSGPNVQHCAICSLSLSALKRSCIRINAAGGA